MRVIKFDTHLWIRVRKSRLDFTQGKSIMMLITTIMVVIMNLLNYMI